MLLDRSDKGDWLRCRNLRRQRQNEESARRARRGTRGAGALSEGSRRDIKCAVTEQGFALNTDIRSPRRRAEDIIERCAHPHFRPLLRGYLKLSAGGDQPRATDMDKLAGWWREYDAACGCFPSQPL